MVALKGCSSPLWLKAVLANFGGFLGDHANCERKAAALALSLVHRHPTRHRLVDAMLGLAREELLHFHRVYRVMRRHGFELASDGPDPYVRSLRALVRGNEAHFLLDQLCVASVIEARGCERFGLLASGLPQGELRDFYAALTRSEARHTDMFATLARHYYDADCVQARLCELYEVEARLVADLPPRAALH